MNKFHAISALALAGGLATGLSGCVDHDYDLSKDIDMTVTIGGDATLPGSSTDVYTLDQLLDLSSNSSIRAVDEGEYGLKAGDYVLTQSADPTTSDVEVDRVNIDNLHGDDYETVLDPLYYASDVAYVTADVTNAVNTMDLSDDDVDSAIKSLEYAVVDIPMEFHINYKSTDYSGRARIDQGFTVEFDKSWVIEIEDAATAAYASKVNDYTLRFTKEQFLNGVDPLVLNVTLTAIDLTKVPSGQGLYAPGKFKLESEVVSNGSVSLSTSDMAVGSVAHLTIVTSTHIDDAVILTATGRIDPDITIEPSDFTINDIPDFLKGNDNHLDITNPQLYLTVNNNSPVEIDVNATLKSICDGEVKAVVGIGKDNGTDQILIEPNTTTRICLSHEAVDDPTATNIIVDNLPELLETVPDRIEIDDITAVAVDKVVTLDLGYTYTFTTNYDVVVPLQFGVDLQLIYTTTEDDWGSDLDKYNFSKAQATMSVINTIPLNMVPDVVALDHEGLIIPGVRATVTGTVEAGTVSEPSTSELTVLIESDVDNLGELDGIRLEFVATTSAKYAGQALNKAQYLKFENIKVGIIGGVTVDLN